MPKTLKHEKEKHNRSVLSLVFLTQPIWQHRVKQNRSTVYLSLCIYRFLPSCRGSGGLCTATCCWGPERLLLPPLPSVWRQTERTHHSTIANMAFDHVALLCPRFRKQPGGRAGQQKMQCLGEIGLLPPWPTLCSTNVTKSILDSHEG